MGQEKRRKKKERRRRGEEEEEEQEEQEEGGARTPDSNCFCFLSVRPCSSLLQVMLVFFSLSLFVFNNVLSKLKPEYLDNTTLARACLF